MTRKVARLNPGAYARIVGELATRPSATARQLADKVGLAYRTVREFMYALEKFNGAHVVGFVANARGVFNVEIYSLGAGLRAPRPVTPGRIEHYSRVLAAEFQVERKVARGALRSVDGDEGKARKLLTASNGAGSI